uniref:Uncharacterized protein n=1 Tax=Chlamydomonas euryale TaxID=1486919 RepID=A0A7R9VYZ3_9CHLO|mmetsp:Transcript_8188/g.24723  ORF Transcript_8188/g.24723 Transcript_8188/m.24723 type:complete len:123 (+) Transcript_8188:1587-1955(+)
MKLSSMQCPMYATRCGSILSPHFVDAAFSRCFLWTQQGKRKARKIQTSGGLTALQKDPRHSSGGGAVAKLSRPLSPTSLCHTPQPFKRKAPHNDCHSYVVDHTNSQRSHTTGRQGAATAGDT